MAVCNSNSEDEFGAVACAQIRDRDGSLPGDNWFRRNTRSLVVARCRHCVWVFCFILDRRAPGQSVLGVADFAAYPDWGGAFADGDPRFVGSGVGAAERSIGRQSARGVTR